MFQPPANDHDLITQIGRVLPIFQHLTKHILVKIQGEDRLTLQQLRSLKAIAASERGLPTSGLARELRIASPTVTRIVDVLVERELVTREEDSDDRRRTRLTLRPDGEGLLARYEHEMHDVLAVRLATLSDVDQNRLRLALDDIELLLRTPDKSSGNTTG